jgi:hypothetical protein
MMQKTNINQAVWKILHSDLAVQKDLSRKILNVRALAKHLMREHDLPASLDSVISAIRRFEANEHFEEEDKVLRHVFRDSVISTKNNMACITLGISPKVLFSKICVNGNRLPALKVTTGSDETKVIVEQPHLEEVKGWFDKKDILSIDKDLSELLVVASDKAVQTKGVLSRIANELSLGNINIHELIMCPPEFIVYVKERDIVKAHETLLKLCQE